MSLSMQYALLAQAPQGGGGASFLITMLLMFAGMYFLLIAPQRKRMKEQQKMIAALQKGDKIMTNAGIYGTITHLKEDRVRIDLGDGHTMDINRQYVQARIDPVEPAATLVADKKK